MKGKEYVTEWMESCYEISLLQPHTQVQCDLSR